MTPIPTLPVSRVPDPRSAPALRWAVMGTGWIAQRFVAALQENTEQNVVAVGSRSAARSADFARRLGIAGSAASYQELAGRKDVDVVYVATEHPAHFDCARIALTSGKHVLVEKPLALNASQARDIADLAAQQQRFCMEALWSFFLPKFDVIRQLLDGGTCGDVHTVLADNGERLTGHRRVMDPAMAGGPMLDLGTYLFALADWVLGPPFSVVASGHAHPAGVNAQLSAVLSTTSHQQAVLHTTVLTDTPCQAFLAGSQASIALPGPFYQPGPFEVLLPDGGRLSYDEPAVGHRALFWQAAEVARCVAEGRSESPLRPLSDSVSTLVAMDEARRRVGISFPGEG